MRADSGLSPGPSDTDGEGDGELAGDPEGRADDVAPAPDEADEQAPVATSSAARVKNQTRREGKRFKDVPQAGCDTSLLLAALSSLHSDRSPNSRASWLTTRSSPSLASAP